MWLIHSLLTILFMLVALVMMWWLARGTKGKAETFSAIRPLQQKRQRATNTFA
jgi:hypothetical protein